jgi:hypothetical protein
VPDQLSADLSASIREFLDPAFAKIDEAIHLFGEDNVIKVALDLYDQHLAPLNIPFVPDSLEPVLIDTPIKVGIAHLIRTGHKAIHREPAPVTPTT